MLYPKLVRAQVASNRVYEFLKLLAKFSTFFQNFIFLREPIMYWAETFAISISSSGPDHLKVQAENAKNMTGKAVFKTFSSTLAFPVPLLDKQQDRLSRFFQTIFNLRQSTYSRNRDLFSSSLINLKTMLL